MRISGIITAAGLSSRMAPDHKLVMDINGQTLIQRSVESLQAFCDQIIVVTGAYPHEIHEALKHKPNIEFVHNPDYLTGMFSSVKTGLNFSRGDRAFILPGDCPYTTYEVCSRLLMTEGEIVIPTFDNHFGHPILLQKDVINELLKNQSFTTLRDFIDSRIVTLVPVNDEKILWDIDTQEDIRKARHHFKEGGSES